jgi:hypothetical protein
VLVKIWRQIKKEAPCRAIHGALSLMSRALHLHVYLAHPPIEYIYAIFSLINLFFLLLLSYYYYVTDTEDKFAFFFSFPFSFLFYIAISCCLSELLTLLLENNRNILFFCCLLGMPHLFQY